MLITEPSEEYRFNFIPFLNVKEVRRWKQRGDMKRIMER
jgi:hypothetical protein